MERGDALDAGRFEEVTEPRLRQRMGEHRERRAIDLRGGGRGADRRLARGRDRLDLAHAELDLDRRLARAAAPLPGEAAELEPEQRVDGLDERPVLVVAGGLGGGEARVQGEPVEARADAPVLLWLQRALDRRGGLLQQVAPEQARLA